MSNHTVTALEPMWVESKYKPDSDNAPQYVGDSERAVHSDGLDHLTSESTFECDCGEELSNWNEVEDHFEEVANMSENEITTDDIESAYKVLEFARDYDEFTQKQSVTLNLAHEYLQYYEQDLEEEGVVDEVVR